MEFNRKLVISAKDWRKAERGKRYYIGDSFEDLQRNKELGYVYVLYNIFPCAALYPFKMQDGTKCSCLYPTPETVYLSGSITKKDNYKQDFKLAEDVFTQKGYTVVNPAALPEEATYAEYIKRDLQALLECDYICFVNDVSTSKGALIERLVAQETGIKEILLEDHR